MTMSSVLIQPSPVSGRVVAPASKSVMLRALTAALLSDGTSTLTGYTPCDDAENAIQLIEALGAKVYRRAGVLEVEGSPPCKSKHPLLVLRCGESGLLSRLFVSVGMLYCNNLELTGEGTLLNRPFAVSNEYFAQLGLQRMASNGNTILRLRGQLQAIQIYVDGSNGSQLLSGLLMALPLLQAASELRVENLQSKPYVDLTIDMLNAFGVEVEREGYTRFCIKGNGHYQPCCYAIEGDWSGASCLLVAGAIGGSVTVSGLSMESLQADKAILDALKYCGAEVGVGEDGIKVSRAKLNPFELDATHCPDLFPALVTLAAACNGISAIKGVSRLRHKESDRATALQQEFTKLQVPISIQDNVMKVTGGNIAGGDVFAHNDHRIAMALAVAGLHAKNAVRISGAECVAKSYPTFFGDLKTLTQHD